MLLQAKGQNMTLLTGLGAIVAVLMRKLKVSVKIKLSYH
jgi:hypothetical protein